MKVLEELKITFQNKNLLKEAFTHTSYANEHHTSSYERLEYLGDAILEFLMSEYLYKNTEHEEGIMTKLRAQYVCEDALYAYSLKLGLNEELLLGHGEEENGGRMRKAIVADIFESFMGALYLDQGIEVVREFFYQYVIPMIEKKEIIFEQDYKSLLQELVQTDRRSLEYLVIDEEGPSHNKTFTVVVKIDGVILGKGTAHSKKEAEQCAAHDALKKAQNS